MDRLVRAGAVLALAAALRLPAIKYPYEYIDEEIGVRETRLRLSNVYHLPNTSLYWDRDLENLERRLANPCQTLLIDVPFTGDGFGERTFARLRSDHTLREIERFSTTFDYVPPSTLHTYFTPPSLFLLRPADEK